jgi:hypothetical protein
MGDRVSPGESEDVMNYLMLVCTDGVPTEGKIAVMQSETPGWASTMDANGVRAYGHQLQDPSTAKTVRVRDGETIVTDGPFVETKEFIAGFDLIKCDNLDEAIDVAAKHPVSWFNGIEVRPFYGDDNGHRPQPMKVADPDASSSRYLLMMCLDGIAEAPEVEASIRREAEAWGDELKARGAQAFGGPLAHANTATMVRVRDGEVLLSDGPFVETKEFIGGVDIIDCSGLEEAIEIASQHPLARYHMVEVRPFMEDSGD